MSFRSFNKIIRGFVLVLLLFISFMVLLFIAFVMGGVIFAISVSVIVREVISLVLALIRSGFLDFSRLFSLVLR